MYKFVLLTVRRDTVICIIFFFFFYVLENVLEDHLGRAESRFEVELRGEGNR